MRETTPGGLFSDIHLNSDNPLFLIKVEEHGSGLKAYLESH